MAKSHRACVHFMRLLQLLLSPFTTHMASDGGQLWGLHQICFPKLGIKTWTNQFMDIMTILIYCVCPYLGGHQHLWPCKCGKWWWSIGIGGTQFWKKPIWCMAWSFKAFLWSMCTRCASPWLLASQPSGDRVVWGQPIWKFLQQKSPTMKPQGPSQNRSSHIQQSRPRRCSPDQAFTFAWRVPVKLGIWMLKTPESSIFGRFSLINDPFGGTPIFGNPHLQTMVSHEFCSNRWNSSSQCFGSPYGHGSKSGMRQAQTWASCVFRVAMELHTELVVAVIAAPILLLSRPWAKWNEDRCEVALLACSLLPPSPKSWSKSWRMFR